MSGDLIKEKAKLLYKGIMIKVDFHARSGWLDKFNTRFGMRLINMTREKLSCHIDTIEPFKEKFIDYWRIKFDPDEIYNAYESELFLLKKVRLTEKTFFHKGKTSALGWKISKNRIIFMLY